MHNHSETTLAQLFKANSHHHKIWQLDIKFLQIVTLHDKTLNKATARTWVHYLVETNRLLLTRNTLAVC